MSMFRVLFHNFLTSIRSHEAQRAVLANATKPVLATRYR